MRAGKLNDIVTLRSVTYVDNGYGGVKEVETDWAALRAQIIEESTEEFIRNWGVSSERLRIFRTRFIDGVTLDMKVMHRGAKLNLKQVKVIGRRRGLELRCVDGG